VDNSPSGPYGRQHDGMDFPGLHRLATAQQGLFTRDQARRLGASPYVLRHKVSTGEWVVVLGDVLAVAGLPLSHRVRERAALLHLPGTVLAGPSAARHHGLMCPDNRIFVAGDTQRQAPTLVRILRTPLGTADVVRLNGVPATELALTVVDCLSILRDEQATDLLDAVLRTKRATRDAIGERIQERIGRRGTPRLIKFLTDRETPGRS
jgi:hypothetical protein